MRTERGAGRSTRAPFFYDSNLPSNPSRGHVGFFGRPTHDDRLREPHGIAAAVGGVGADVSASAHRDGGGHGLVRWPGVSVAGHLQAVGENEKGIFCASPVGVGIHVQLTAVGSVLSGQWHPGHDGAGRGMCGEGAAGRGVSGELRDMACGPRDSRHARCFVAGAAGGSVHSGALNSFSLL